MKFKVSTAGYYYTEEQAEKLKMLGFTFGINENDEKRRLHKINDKIEIEIATLEELIAFSKQWREIIVSDGNIEIYDDYRE